MPSVSMLQRRFAEVVDFERRRDVRVITNIAGRYMLGSKRDDHGNRREFACRALNMSAQGMMLAAPVSGPVGERVIAYFGQFGKLEGTIARLMERGFVMTISGTPAERARLAAKLAWLEDHKNHDIPDSRRYKRIVPRRPYSTLTLVDGTTSTCLVIDMSISGVAVSADMVPDIGTPIAIGTVVGRVRRRFAEGFAIEFAETQDLETLPHRLMRL
ncbi:PilZ domain-containing protein [Phreatobacter stygius]|uniref:PilZ domain-containing protein n=1 Tax=Phreatobacter stygius TaxID=1940610 RepID=A0A4D7B1M2_9HYPH|nr:PilZ domain-containing protein [Phreatobacter stygius]QCI63406.1 PilZ domain-containing protein [Phreatobacter stygius]